MEAWRTYTPDGRVLEVEYADGTWVAFCNGAREERSSAAEAILAALDTREATIGVEPEIGAWVAEHAARLEAEAG